MTFELDERLETLREDIEMDLRNGMVSADTKLITKAILLTALQLKEISVDIAAIANGDHILDVENKLENITNALNEIDKSIYSNS